MRIIPQASWVLPGQLFCLQQVPGTLTSWAEMRGAGDSAESQNPHLQLAPPFRLSLGSIICEMGRLLLTNLILPFFLRALP